MPKTDTDPLGDGFKWRLRAELNRISPRYSSPRYLAPARRRIGAWRFAPVVIGAGVVGMVGLTAFAATGSPNPAVWTQQIVTRIEPNTATPPPPGQSPSPEDRAPAPPTHEAEPTERPEPSETSRPSPSPEHERDGESPSPSPEDR